MANSVSHFQHFPALQSGSDNATPAIFTPANSVSPQCINVSCKILECVARFLDDSQDHTCNCVHWQTSAVRSLRKRNIRSGRQVHPLELGSTKARLYKERWTSSSSGAWLHQGSTVQGAADKFILWSLASPRLDCTRSSGQVHPLELGSTKARLYKERWTSSSSGAWLHQDSTVQGAVDKFILWSLAPPRLGCTRSGGQVHPLELGSTKARLYIDCARPSDAGLYTCVAETTTKRITTTTFLYVGQLDHLSIQACSSKRYSLPPSTWR